jgi:membrane protein required for colicin V production
VEAYDIIMIAVLGGATFFGFLKGFAWQLASLASLILSYIAALRFGDALAPQLNVNPAYSKYVAMLIIYCVVSLVVWLAFRAISGTIDRIKLREFDRQMGGLFGLLKGALICFVITFFAVTLSENTRGAVLKSKSGPYLAQALHKAEPVMPPELAKLLGPYIDKLERGLDPTQTVEHPQLPNVPLPNTNGVIPSALMPAGFDASQNYPQYAPSNNGPPPSFPTQFNNESGQYPPPLNR